MQPFYCSSCGKQNPPDAKFCNECAKPMVQAPPLLPEAPVPLTPKPVSKVFYLGLGFFLFCAIGIILIAVQVNKFKSRQAVEDQSKLNGGDVVSPTQSKSQTPTEALKEAKEILKTKDAEDRRFYVYTLLNEIPAEAPEYKEAQQLLKPLSAKIALAQKRKDEKDAPILRDQLLQSYKSSFANANPYLNFIKSKMTKEKNGYSLWLIHSMFTQSSFDVGDMAYVVNQWINENRNELYKASIVKVGLRNESGYLGTCWLEIK
jgi:hypothetical protein